MTQAEETPVLFHGDTMVCKSGDFLIVRYVTGGEVRVPLTQPRTPGWVTDYLYGRQRNADA